MSYSCVKQLFCEVCQLETDHIAPPIEDPVCIPCHWPNREEDYNYQCYIDSVEEMVQEYEKKQY